MKFDIQIISEWSKVFFEGLSKLKLIPFQVIRIVYIQNYSIKKVDLLPVH